MSQSWSRGLGCALLFVYAGCGESHDSKGDVDSTESALLTGRVFGSTDGKPLKEAAVSVSGASVKSATDGSFEVHYVVDTSAKKTVRATRADHAPVTKAAPDGDGYVELFAKEIDAKQTIDPVSGGEVKSSSGAGLKVAGDSLKDRTGKSPKSVQLVIAAPDLTKSQDLSSLPGDFSAKRADQKGKLSTESTIYVQATDENGDELVVAEGKKITVTVPGSNKKANQRSLYRYDEALASWLEAASLTATTDAEGREVYQADVDALGWFSLGTFVEQLSCVRACVVKPDQTPVPFAHAVATGLTLTTQADVYAGQDGCFALDVPANIELSLSVQSRGSFGFGGLVTSGSGGSAAVPESCAALGNIVLDRVAAPTATCSLGSSECGALCIDTQRDAQNCGACGTICGGTQRCLGGSCRELTSPPAPVTDAGMPPPVPPEPDAGTTSDAGNEPDPIACTSDPGCEAPIGCFARVPGNSELGTTDFCISRFENKELQGVPAALPTGAPWTLNQGALATSSCATLGPEYTMPTNAQWQTLARNIESVASNWSGGAVGVGDLARGHVDGAPATFLSVSNVDDPCDQSLAPACTTDAATFGQRRTHLLSTGSTIWDVGGNVIEWVQPVPTTIYFGGYAASLANAASDLQLAFGPAGNYPVTASPAVSSNYPGYAIVEADALAIVDGQNFSSGQIWVRNGGTLFLRGSNYQGDVFLEAGAMYLNSGSNVYAPGQVTYSAAAVTTGTLGTNNPLLAEGNYAECGGTCPATIQRFTQDGSRGLGYTLIFSNNQIEWRGGRMGMGPAGGAFTALTPYNAGTTAGFRCVKALSP